MLEIVLGALLGILLYRIARWTLHVVIDPAFRTAVWKSRHQSLFAWAAWDTYLRQKGWRKGPRLGHLTRQARRRIAREYAKRLF